MDNRRVLGVVRSHFPLSMAKKFSDSTLALLSPRAVSMLDNSNHQKPSNQVSKEILQMRCKRADKKLWIAAAKLAVKQGTVKADQRGTLAPWAVQTLNEAAEAYKRARSRTG